MLTEESWGAGVYIYRAPDMIGHIDSVKSMKPYFELDYHLTPRWNNYELMYEELRAYRKFCLKVLRKAGISKRKVGEELLDFNFMIEEDGCITVDYITSGKRLSDLTTIKRLRQAIINMCKFKFVRPVTKRNQVGYAFWGVYLYR